MLTKWCRFLYYRNYSIGQTSVCPDGVRVLTGLSQP